MDEIINDIAPGAYADEPCRICGRLLTRQDIKDGAVFAGYSPDSKSRAAHKKCYEGAKAVFGEVDFEAQISAALLKTPKGRKFLARLRTAEQTIEQLRTFHPRAWKLMEKGKNFIVVAKDEPYFLEVYTKIREHELQAGRWTDEDEFHYDLFRTSSKADREGKTP